MKTKNYRPAALLIQEIKKYMHYPFSIPAIAGTVCLCFAAQGAMDDTGNPVSIFSLLLYGDPSGYETGITSSSLLLWIQGCGTHVELMIPFLLTCGYIITLSAERKSGMTGLLLLRAGNIKFCLMKTAAGALAGGLLFAGGYALYGVILHFCAPPFHTFPAEEQALFAQMYQIGSSVPLFIVRRMAGAFLYGMSACIPGICTAIIFRNKYMLMCLPFLSGYIYNQLISRLLLNALSQSDELYQQLLVFRFSSILNVSGDRYWYFTLGLLFSLYLFMVILFFMEIKRRRWDG